MVENPSRHSSPSPSPATLTFAPSRTCPSAPSSAPTAAVSPSHPRPPPHNRPRRRLLDDGGCWWTTAAACRRQSLARVSRYSPRSSPSHVPLPSSPAASLLLCTPTSLCGIDAGGEKTWRIDSPRPDVTVRPLGEQEMRMPWQSSAARSPQSMHSRSPLCKVSSLFSLIPIISLSLSLSLRETLLLAEVKVKACSSCLI